MLETPVNVFYPPENKELQLRLMREHMVISQFPIGSPVTRKKLRHQEQDHGAPLRRYGHRRGWGGDGVTSQAWESIRLNRPLFVTSIVESRSRSWLSKLKRYGAVVLSDPDSLDDLLDLLPWTSTQELLEQLKRLL